MVRSPVSVARVVVAVFLGVVLGAGWLVAGAAPSSAVEVPPKPDQGSVQDQAEILSPSQEQQLNEQIARKNKDNDHARVAVLTTRDTGGESIEDYSRRVATTWGVGDSGTENGVLIVADMGGRELRIEVADGVREVLSDADAQDIMEDQLEPAFKDERYAEGLTRTVNAIYEQADPQAAAARQKKSSTITSVVVGALVLMVAAAAVFVTRWIRRDRQLRRQADEEIDRYQRENPGEEISEKVRKAYRDYRAGHPKPPKEGGKPRTAKDQDGQEREVHYAQNFRSWLPLYMMYPAIYGTSSAGSSAADGGSGISSFGGGAGFTGGGASGSF